MRWIRKMICSHKGHKDKKLHKEPDGWGKVWQWKKCDRCGRSTFDAYPAEEDRSC